LSDTSKHNRPKRAIQKSEWLFANIERNKAEESLRAASVYARTLIEASLDPLVTISADGKITDVNEASVKVTGIARDQLIGTDFSSYFTDPDKAREGYLKVFSDGFVHDYPLAIRHVSGLITEVLYNASVYKDEFGAVQGVFAAARDVTERNRALQALKQAHDELEARVAERTAALLDANEQMKKVSFELVWAEEKERERIAGELHDQVGQSLLLAKMKLDALVANINSDALFMQAEEAASLLANSIQDIRSLTFRMRPPILDTSGIETALEWLCSSIKSDYALQIDFTDDGHPKPLPAEVRYSLYHAVRELLLNVAKHAGTDKAQLSMKANNHTLEVNVIDHGIGFSHPDAHLKHIKNGGYGLYNVQQRIEQIGGRVVIASSAGSGTSVTLTVPLEGSR
jgi:PAS domain S-box-containing protein